MDSTADQKDAIKEKTEGQEAVGIFEADFDLGAIIAM
jgi:hypothetical protein